LSEENVELVRVLYDAFDSKDLDSVVSLKSDDMVAHVAPGVPWSGTYHGPEGFRRFLETIDEYVELSIETGALLDSGSEVKQVGRSTGYARVSGTVFSFDEVHIWGVKDGEIVSFSNHSDIDEQRRVLAPDLELTL
jgi:ketosteroid isomerase-like protein